MGGPGTTGPPVGDDPDDTVPVNLTLMQCEFHTGKKTVIARIKSIIGI